MIEIGFNELSMRTPAGDAYQARERMSALVTVIRELRRHGFRGPLRTVRGLTARALAPGYLLVQWLNDEGVESNARILFKTLATKAPHVEDLIAEAEDADDAAYEFTVAGEPSLGLGLAYIRDCPAVSLHGDPLFQGDPVTMHFVWVGPDGDRDEPVQVCCLTRLDQVAPRLQWLETRVRDAVNDGSQLWVSRADIFPYLQFCASTAAQLQALSGTEPYFVQIVRHLRVLNEYLESWVAGPFALAGIPWSDESNATMQQYGELRRIDCLGQVREFRYHTKPTGGNVRIHFLPYRVDTGRAFVGYVGPHLPTVLEPGH